MSDYYAEARRTQSYRGEQKGAGEWNSRRMARAKTAGQAGEWNSRLNGAGKNSRAGWRMEFAPQWRGQKQPAPVVHLRGRRRMINAKTASPALFKDSSQR